MSQTCNPCNEKVFANINQLIAIIKANEKGTDYIFSTPDGKAIYELLLLVQQNETYSDEQLTLIWTAINNITNQLIISNTFSDWRLPSKNELELYINEVWIAVGVYLPFEYWTSTEIDSTHAGVWKFTPGMPVYKSVLKSSSTPTIIPIREFTSTKLYSLSSQGEKGYIFKITDNLNGTYTYLEGKLPENELTATNNWSNIINQSVTGTSELINYGLINSNLIIEQTGHTGSSAQDCLNLNITDATFEILGAFIYNSIVALLENLDILAEIGDINYSDLNSQGIGSTEFDIIFTDKKPVGKYLANIFFKNTETLESYSYGYVENTVSNIFLKENATDPNINIKNALIPAKVIENITIGLELSEENLQDWTAGNIKVYAIFKNYPNI